MGVITINVENDRIQRLDIPVGTGLLTIVLGNVGFDPIPAGANPVIIDLNQKLNNIIGIPTVIGSANYTTEYLIPANLNLSNEIQLVDPIICKCEETTTENEYKCEIEKPFLAEIELRDPYCNWIPATFKPEWKRRSKTLNCKIEIHRGSPFGEPGGQISFLKYQIYIHHNK